MTLLGSALTTEDCSTDRRISRYPVDFNCVDTHWLMLQNREKYHSFAAALARVVRRQEVIEVGTGTGILALLAVRLGAEFVWAVEREPMACVSERLLHYFPDEAERIELVVGDFQEITSPMSTSCSVGLTETLGYLAVEENILGVAAGMKGWMSEGNRQILPASISVGFIPARGIGRGAAGAGPFLYSGDYVTARGRSSPRDILLDSPPREIQINIRWESLADQDISSLLVFSRGNFSQGGCFGSAVNRSWPYCAIPLSKPFRVCDGEHLELSLNFTANNLEYDVQFKLYAYSDCGVQDVHSGRFGSSTVAASPFASKAPDAPELAAYMRRLIEECCESPRR